MAEVKINRFRDGCYLFSDITSSNGNFEVVAEFKTWKDGLGPDDRYPELINVRLFNKHENINCGITKMNYCKSKKKLEIHVETVHDRTQSLPYELVYEDSKKEELFFTYDKKIEVVIWLYNSDPDKHEYRFQICENISTECLEFSPDEKELFTGFSPERKGGSILVGG